MNVGIIGGGAAGIMAAISSARNGYNVTILEHGVKVGKKILATGNGKCNFTNRDMGINHYNDGGRNLFSSVYNRFNNKDTISLFTELGIMPYEKNGYFYPRSEQAVSVLDCLLYELTRLKVNIITECNVVKIKKEKDFFVDTDKGKFKFSKLIIAAGSMVSPKSGSDGSGFSLAKSLGHDIVKPLPALCGLKCENKKIKMVSGVRCKAKVTLYINGKIEKEDSGEIQFVDYGISGIPVFQISDKAVRAIDDGKSVKVVMNLFQEAKNEEETLNIITNRINNSKEKTVEQMLTGMFNSKLIKLILNDCSIDPGYKCNKLEDKEINSLVNSIHHLNIKINGYNFDNAQVCSGGINIDSINTSLESKLVEGLYFAGEILDINGDCGGYNLQWAWSSGYVAGLLG